MYRVQWGPIILWKRKDDPSYNFKLSNEHFIQQLYSVLRVRPISLNKSDFKSLMKPHLINKRLLGCRLFIPEFIGTISGYSLPQVIVVSCIAYKSILKFS